MPALDAFDLNDYLKAVHFDEIKLPPSLPQRTSRKEYYGIKEFMEGELDFVKATVLSKSTDDCIMYSDMPLEEMAADPEFPKKYMFGLAMMLKKGLHIHHIHDVNRPFPEMMIGLESWIPLYMTGQISPYYLPLSQSQVFLHFLKVSGAAALEGTAIAGDQASGRYVLFRSRSDVKHVRTRAEQLLAKASPLMDIYRKDDAQLFHAVQQTAFSENDCKMICSNLPVYAVPEDLLEKILDRAWTERMPVRRPAKPLRATAGRRRRRWQHRARNTPCIWSCPPRIPRSSKTARRGLPSPTSFSMKRSLFLTRNTPPA